MTFFARFTSLLGKPKAKPSPIRRRPMLEHLESRITPTTYVWMGDRGSNWRDGGSWVRNGIFRGLVPGETDDAVIPTTAVSNPTIFPTETFRVGSLRSRVDAGGTGDPFLHVQGTLTITGQGATDSSWSQGCIDIGGQLIVSGGGTRFDWDGGRIESLASIDTARLVVANFATLNITGSPSSLEVALNVGDSALGPGTVTLGGMANNSTVKRGVDIRVGPSSKLIFEQDHAMASAGGIVQVSASDVLEGTIKNSGLVWRKSSDSAYVYTNMGIDNDNGGTLRLDPNTSLSVFNTLDDGLAASVVAADNSVVQLGAGSTLLTRRGVRLSAATSEFRAMGDVKDLADTGVTLGGDLVAFDGTVRVGAFSDKYTTLTLPYGNLDLIGATLNMKVDGQTDGHGDNIVLWLGSATISPTAAVLQVNT